MILKDVYQKYVDGNYVVDLIGICGSRAEWKDVEVDYPDEWLGTHGDEEVADVAYQPKQHILLVKLVNYRKEE